jgi:hypothetical protein
MQSLMLIVTVLIVNTVVQRVNTGRQLTVCRIIRIRRIKLGNHLYEYEWLLSVRLSFDFS